MTSPLVTPARNTINVFGLSHMGILDGSTGAEAADLYGVRSGQLGLDVGNSDVTGDEAVLDTWNWINFATVGAEAAYIPFDTLSLISGAPLEVTGDPTPAAIEFSPAATGGSDAYDYTTNAVTFTVSDGTTTGTVTLDADYTNLAGVVAAVDADLPAGFTVTAAAGRVRVAATTPGAVDFTVGGANAAAVTGSAGYRNIPGTAGDIVQTDLWREDAANQPPRPVVLRSPARDRMGRARWLDILIFKLQFAPFGLNGPAYRTGTTLTLSGKGLMSDVDEKGDPLPGGIRAVGRLINRPA